MDLTRYAKQIKLPSVNTEGQRKLAKAKILIVGCGGLGVPSSLYLVAGGVGEIMLIDNDKIELSNLHRQPIYKEKDIGKSKAEVLAAHLTLMNTDISISYRIEKFTSYNYQLIKDYDLILDCADNFETTYLINHACIIHKKPWVMGSIQGWQGQFGLFNVEGSGCYTCLYEHPPIDSDSLDCDNFGIMGSVAGLVGLYQANLALQYILEVHLGSLNKIYICDFEQIDLKKIAYSTNIPLIKKLSETHILKSSIEVEISFLIGNRNEIFFIAIKEDWEEPFALADANINYDNLLQNGLPIDINKGIVVVGCENGIRSKAIVKHILQQEGSDKKVYSLVGGLSKL